MPSKTKESSKTSSTQEVKKADVASTTAPATGTSVSTPASKPKSTKSKQPKTEEVVDEPVVEQAAPPASSSKSRKSKAVSESESKSSSAPAPVSVPEASEEEAPEDEDSGRKQRRVVSREEVEKSVDSLAASVDAEVEFFRENALDSKSRARVVKFLRTVSKQLRQVKTDFVKLSSKKKTKTCSSNSGFMKAVQISPEMHKFAGIADNQLVSRVDVTKAICKYVKDHNLQNEGDKRLFTPDDKLAKLLGSKTPITYYNLQKAIQPHFVKAASA
jgi:chromatin remodeling complex protein RSC6